MEFTDFIVWVKGGQAVEFRHKAKSVHELWLIQDELICDFYGFQCIRRSDIREIRLDPRPFYSAYLKKFKRYPYGYTRELWAFIHSFNEEEQEQLKREYYRFEMDGRLE